MQKMRIGDGSGFSLSEKFDDVGIVTGDMRICAILAALDLSAVLLEHLIGARAVVHVIQRTVAEHAVEILRAVVAGVEAAGFVGKEDC